MIVMYIAVIVGALSFGAFGFSYQINGINRAVISMPISIYESSVRLDEETNVPYFNKELLNEKLTYYFTGAIERYSKDFKLEYLFSNGLDGTFCIVNRCQVVTVKVTATLMYDYKYERQMYYSIAKS